MFERLPENSLAHTHTKLAGNADEPGYALTLGKNQKIALLITNKIIRTKYRFNETSCEIVKFDLTCITAFHDFHVVLRALLP